MKTWKDLWNSESEESYWEIWHDSTKETVTLHYVPEEDYSDKDVKIEVSYKEFEDLLGFMKNLGGKIRNTITLSGNFKIKGKDLLL